MQVDNFARIRELMHFDCDGDIYFIEVLVRGKDHGTTGERLIRDYHVHSMDQFDQLEAEIKFMCDSYGARAYIRLNLRNVEDANIHAQIEMLKEQLTRNQTVRKAIRTGNTNTILKDKMNRIRSATRAEVLPLLLQQTYRPADPEALSRTLFLVDELSRRVKLFRLGCNMDPEAAFISHNAMVNAAGEVLPNE